MVDVGTLATFAVVAFAGGAVGAAMGGLPAFSFAGLIITVGEVAKMGGGGAGTSPGLPSLSSLPASDVTTAIGLGPGLGPHVAFAGGVAAAAYAARKEYLDTDFEYHEAKHVTYALGTPPDVLVVGGAFGVLGLLVMEASLSLGLPWDPIAFAIVVSAFVHRLAFGYPLVGNVRGNVLDMSPFERGARRRRRTAESGGRRRSPGAEADMARGGATDAHDDGAVDPADAAGPGRFVVEPWLPHQYRWASVAVLGAVVGVFGAFVVHRTGSVFLAFGITAATLVFLNLGMERMPVTHHMALPASIVVVGLAGAADQGVLANGVTPNEFAATVPLGVALLAGALFGVLAGLAGELSQRVLYAHADTHLDPPAAAIVVATLLIAVLDMVGVLTQNVVPTL